MSAYPVTLKPDDNDTLLVTFPDVPEAITFGEDEADALVRAVSALETALMFYMDARKPIPVPSKPKRGQHTVTLPALSAAKVGLYETMRAAGVRKADLARKLGLHAPQIDRLLDLRHASRLDQVEAALKVLGKELVVDIRAATRSVVGRPAA